MKHEDGKQSQLDLASLRAKLADKTGPQYWRSLEELANTPEFQRFLEDEFPSRAEDLHNPASRRDMLRLMAASFALAGLTGCTKQPVERILPYVRQPEAIVLGKPLFFASSMPFRGSSVGVLVESREGRPIKVEGNPLHPGSLGRTFPMQQTSTLDLYDPGRSQAVLYRGRISTWGQFVSAMADLRQKMGTGEGFHVLTEPMHSPTLMSQRDELISMFPAMQWYAYDAVSTDTSAQTVFGATGSSAVPVYDFNRADVVLSLDADFLYAMPGSIAYARAFISRRHAEADRRRMNRLYVVEPTLTITGTTADHRIPLKATLVEAFASRVAQTLGVAGAQVSAPLSPELMRVADIVARDLQSHRGASLVVAGEHQRPSVHALTERINQALGSIGATVRYLEAPDTTAAGRVQPLGRLVEAMRGGRVQTLIVSGSNPVYTAPADYDFARLYEKVPLRVHQGIELDETGILSHWHLPETHYLEAWSDALAYDGTASIIQPLIAPLYEGRTAHELLATLAGNADRSPYDIVKSYWRRQYGGTDFELAWQRWVHDGVIPNTGSPAAPAAGDAQQRTTTAEAQAPITSGLEIVFRPDPCVWDGRFANNAWLQELPKPHSKITWDNAAYMSPRTAERLGLENQQVVELQYRGRSVRAPIWIAPGQVDDSVTVFLGYGRRQVGVVGRGIGYDAYSVRTSAHPFFDGGLEVRPTGDKYILATTQTHYSMEGRDLVRVAENGEFLRNPQIFEGEHDLQRHFSLYPEWAYTGYRWGMSIDLNACIGCNACVVACVAENNIPVVGKEQVARGREMHWLRIDHYYSGPLDNPSSVFEPVLCMHCEKAPCEPVCPVAATLHDNEGLNQMIYNRCVGTRYCSNNCPYKVRRFNFLLYSEWNLANVAMLHNPQVTVRSRGVMEKCTYCIQRIKAAKIEAEKERRRIRDGEIVTACQSACPTDAIIFGDLNDKTTRAHRLRENPLTFVLLEGLGTQPRTSYLARLRNRNPELEQRT